MGNKNGPSGGAGSDREMRMVGAVFFVLLTAIGIWQLTKDRATAGWILVGIAGYFGIGAALLPVILKPFYVVWMKFAFALGWFNARLLLGLCYVLLVTPMALVGKLLRKDGLGRKLDQAETSYWHGRDDESKKARERYEKQF